MKNPVKIAWIALIGAGTLNQGCFYEPCDDYVDYICSCHEDDPEFDCEELRTIYAEADPELQEYCSTALNEQLDEDEAEGLECEW